MKIFIFSFNILMLFFILSAKERKTTNNYSQPFANRQLNSFLPVHSNAKGELFLRLEHTNNNAFFRSNDVNSVFLIGKNHLLVDRGRYAQLLNVNKNKNLGSKRKDSGGFIILEDDTFYLPVFGDIYRYAIHNYKSTIKPLYSVDIFYDTIQMEYFYPENQQYLAFSNYPPTPHNDPPYAMAVSKNYKDKSNNWTHRFKTSIPRPPIFIGTKNLVIGFRNQINLLNAKSGKLTPFYKGKFNPYSMAIGPDNILYCYCINRDGYLIKAINKNGTLLWEKRTKIHRISQPPIVYRNSTVFIVGISAVEVFRKGNKLWEFPLDNVPYSQKASVLDNGALLVATGNRILHINEFGKINCHFSD